MKRRLSLALRLVVAAAGIAYICWTLTWHDLVLLPAGYDGWPGDYSHDQPIRVKVIGDDRQTLTLQPPANSQLPPFTIQRAELQAPGTGPRLERGVVTTLRGARIGLLAGAMLLTGLIFPIQTLRWLILMRCRALDVQPVKAFRLQMVGAFFNFCMPGMTGGDVVKAYYAAKGSGKRGAAVMSVVFDRLSGIFGLLLMAGCVGLLRLEDPLAQRITLVIWAGFALGVLVSLVYFSRRLRRALRIDRMVAKLPGDKFLSRVDEAALAYGNHKTALLMAVILSLPVHISLTVATSLAGYALGMELDLGLLVVVLPVVFFVGAVPITFLGVGTMEPVAVALLATGELATPNQIVGMLVLHRLFMIFFGLLGSLALLRGDIQLSSRESAGGSS